MATRFIGTFASIEVCASRNDISSSGSTLLVRGSSTMRTGWSPSESSRWDSSSASVAALRLAWSGVRDFLPAFDLGFTSSSISSSTRAALVLGGSSVTATRYWPRASFSTLQRARTRMLPRPVS